MRITRQCIQSLEFVHIRRPHPGSCFMRARNLREQMICGTHCDYNTGYGYRGPVNTLTWYCENGSPWTCIHCIHTPHGVSIGCAVQYIFDKFNRRISSFLFFSILKIYAYKLKFSAMFFLTKFGNFEILYLLNAVVKELKKCFKYVLYSKRYYWIVKIMSLILRFILRFCGVQGEY